MAYRAMIVDDSPVARRVLRRALEMSGLKFAEVYEAGEGSSALVALQVHWIDLVISDMHMPGMSGEQLVRAMQAAPALASIPVIVVSSDDTPGRRAALLEAGAKAYLTKPVAPEALRSAVLALLYPELDDVG